LGMFLNQEILNFETSNVTEKRRFAEINKVSLNTISEMSKLLKFQPDTVVGHILNNLKKATRYTGDIDWGTLLDQIIKLIPKTINEKMHLFFQSYIPKGKFDEQEGDYNFSRKEIINICSESLSILFADYDEFAVSLCRNLAKSIYLICGLKWE
jgi:hypothetical protein